MARIFHIQCIEKQIQINFHILEAAIVKRTQLKAFNNQAALLIFIIIENEK
jgi:hypothetical protein